MTDNVIRGEFPSERDARLRRAADLCDALRASLAGDPEPLETTLRRPAGEICPFPRREG
jgi:hypothetical protein